MLAPAEVVLGDFLQGLDDLAAGADSAGEVSLAQYIDRMHHGFVWGRHHRLLVRSLELVEEGAIDRLIFTLPPRHGKSATASVMFPAWFLGRNPDLFIISACHTQDLANEFSADVRAQLENADWPFPGVHLRRGNKAVKTWRLGGRRGRYQTTGVGGSPAGRGGHVVLIDDPVKSREAADSPVQRAKVWRWFNSDIYTRLQPGAAIVLVSTLWHEDDLTGRLANGMADGTGERYDWIHLPAICRDHPQPGALVPFSERWNELFTLEDNAAFGAVPGRHDPVGRQEGEALWPAWYGLEALGRIRRQLEREEGGRAWTCLYQGDPTPPEGNLFRPEHFLNRYRDIHDLDLQRTFLFVDGAFKTGVSNSYSSIAVWALVRADGGAHRLAVLDLWRDKVPYDALELAVQDMWAKWSRPGRPAEVHIEDKASGQSLLQTLGNKTMIPLMPWKPPTSASKESRAEDALPPFRAGLVLLPTVAPWLQGWIDEHRNFPAGAFDDQVDTTSMAVSVLYARLTAPAAAQHDQTDSYTDRRPEDSLQGAYGAARGRLLGG